MTAGNNGADTPENDDPFAYLYRAEGGEGGAQGSAGDGAAPRQPGVPRTSYNQVRAVGQRQYGQQAPQQVTYGQQNAHYAAPETLPGGDRTRSAPAPGNGGQEPRRGRNGLLIGAVAVVAVVCIGIGVAMLTNGNDSKDDNAGKPGPTAGDKVEPTDKPTSKPAPGELPKQDAGSLRLEGGAATAKDVPGARSPGGAYVAGMNTQGAAATWSLDVEAAGKYKLWVGYGVPGTDANLTLNVNGAADSRPIRLKNFAHAPEGAWDKGWTRSWSYVQLNKGTNTIKLSCESGNQCDVNLDKVWLARS
ncbi:carbohydrate-binding protein [Streptomyces lydicus]|uniref:Carbohydrate-binding protein n=1 Tax=Streptomyces lydicus TaxID=47763 RepID=A0A3S9YEV0_9ACTN|nr:carbohydrate-binding protein [Streptomyces lydicus]AZS73549.1 carbohydrate-binding protein [Streptomyces lydicus]